MEGNHQKGEKNLQKEIVQDLQRRENDQEAMIEEIANVEVVQKVRSEETSVHEVLKIVDERMIAPEALKFAEKGMFVQKAPKIADEGMIAQKAQKIIDEGTMALKVLKISEEKTIARKVRNEEKIASVPVVRQEDPQNPPENWLPVVAERPFRAARPHQNHRRSDRPIVDERTFPTTMTKMADVQNPKISASSQRRAKSSS